ncbi:MAG: hypothetical protein QOF14_979 [Hyphomicrobiales bacterium]|jgi:hypothetical protein|nr:hypothetical protein [Hyphomicrobiales bacterium]
MLKRTFAIVVSAAFLAGATAVILPVERAAAEMATQEKSKAKPGMSGKERRDKCSAEWKEMKAAGKTSALKWPKFYSDCNKRLKAQGT